jgi:hypothetical protein
MQRDRDADEHRNSRIYESLNHRSPHIIPFQFYDPVLGQRHSPGCPLPTSMSILASIRLNFSNTSC